MSACHRNRPLAAAQPETVSQCHRNANGSQGPEMGNQ